jgi:hypothetical protein
MNKPSRIAKKTVELEAAGARGSKIRREPAQPDKLDTLAKKINWGSREWEIRLAIGGIVFFALAICALVVDLGEFISWK